MSKYKIHGCRKVMTDKGYDLVSRSSGITVSVTDSADILMFDIRSPENAASMEFTASTDDWDEMCRMYAECWITWVTAEIGMGFHPDTPADDYSPSLASPLNGEYDLMIGFAHVHLEDVYAVGMEAMGRLGFTQSPAIN
ncbi:hypothetical protein G6L37_02330 [Agrobacterium rubi]|nr:hypothetical protein [Agrobacterium rubi]NTF24232.1 hypothetical protein [Agrobacterium rubi]